MTNRFAIAVLVFAGIVAGATPFAGAGQASASPLSGYLLVGTELPSGWTAVTPTQPFHGSCFQQAKSAIKKGWTSASFTDHRASIEEYLTGASDRARWQALLANLSTCRHFHFHGSTGTLVGLVQAAKLPTVGTASSSYSVAIIGNSVFSLVDDVVLFRAQTKLGALVYIGVGKPSSTTVTAFADAAAAKAEGEPVPAINTAGPGTSS